jgi:hypothetical protein
MPGRPYLKGVAAVLISILMIRIGLRLIRRSHDLVAAAPGWGRQEPARPHAGNYPAIPAVMRRAYWVPC